MSPALHTLHRLREHARKESDVLVRQAERARDVQSERVDSIHASVAQARENVDGTDALELTAYHAFRLRQELASRRESARLSQKERELENQRVRHGARVRDELALANVIEAAALTDSEDRRRREDKRMDEVAARTVGVNSVQGRSA